MTANKNHFIIAVVIVYSLFLLSCQGDTSSSSNDEEPISHSTARNISNPAIKRAVDAALRVDFNQCISIVDSLLKIDSMDIEANYVMSEFYLTAGTEYYTRFYDRLLAAGARREAAIIHVKEALFLGLGSFESRLGEALEIYPGEPELLFAKWLNELDNAAIGENARKASWFSQNVLFRTYPYQAMYNYTCNADPRLALAYLDTLEMMFPDIYLKKHRTELELLSSIDGFKKGRKEYELEYADCGVGSGLYMTDKKGNKIKMMLDTGTSGKLFTIHRDSIGKALDGVDTLLVKNGIRYGYMSESADLHYKLSNFTDPAFDNFLLAYYEGDLPGKDGVFSPFAFEGYAISLDPFEKTAFLRNEKALKKYLKKLDNYCAVNYIVRRGWIYIPGRINGREVLMMVETGSRDVCVNKMMTQAIGLETYQSTVEWRGRDIATVKSDFTLEIGDIKREVKGALVIRSAMGNLLYGLGSSGDLGPTFFKDYAFTIDPFNKQIIFELS